MQTGNHALAIETERYKSNRKAYEDPICVNRDTNEVEDLFHFICKCSAYSLTRNSNTPFMISCEKHDFYEMMNTLNLPQKNSLSAKSTKQMPSELYILNRMLIKSSKHCMAVKHKNSSILMMKYGFGLHNVS